MYTFEMVKRVRERGGIHIYIYIAQSDSINSVLNLLDGVRESLEEN